MAPSGSQRIDKWLFFSRAVKSRSLAAKLVALGRVRINGRRIEHSSETVKPGDTLTLTMDRDILVWRVVDPGSRRGPAQEAHALYEDLSVQQTRNAPPSELVPLRQAHPKARG